MPDALTFAVGTDTDHILACWWHQLSGPQGRVGFSCSAPPPATPVFDITRLQSATGQWKDSLLFLTIVTGHDPTLAHYNQGEKACKVLKNIKSCKSFVCLQYVPVYHKGYHLNRWKVSASFFYGTPDFTSLDAFTHHIDAYTHAIVKSPSTIPPVEPYYSQIVLRLNSAPSPPHLSISRSSSGLVMSLSLPTGTVGSTWTHLSHSICTDQPPEPERFAIHVSFKCKSVYSLDKKVS